MNPKTESPRHVGSSAIVWRWRDNAEELEMQALRHAGQYGRSNDVWVKLTVRAATLKDCAAELEMHCDHEWHALARLPKGWQDVCVKCGEHRLVPNTQALPHGGAERTPNENRD